MSTPVSAPTWQSLYQDWTAQAASGAPDAAVYSERLKVIEPTLKALGITGADGAPPTISVKAESPSGTGAGNTLFPNGSSGKSYAPPDSPAPVSDAQGHTQGHIVATDPSTYDKYINEACDYYDKKWSPKLAQQIGATTEKQTDIARGSDCRVAQRIETKRDVRGVAC